MQIGVLIASGLIIVLAAIAAISARRTRGRTPESGTAWNRFADDQAAKIAAWIESGNTPDLCASLRSFSGWVERSEAGVTVLGFAVRECLCGRVAQDIVRLLLDAGADPNAPYLPGGDALIVRVLEDRSPTSNSLFKLLLEYGADPDTRDRHRTPVIHLGKGQFVKLKLLLDSGADVNLYSDHRPSRGWTPAMSLVAEGAYDEALYLIQRGADPHHKSPSGETLYSLVEQKRWSAVQSSAKLPDSFKALANTITVYGRIR